MSDSPDQALLEAASRAFAAHGYAGASMERIAAEAGLSRVTLHRRGVTKDGLLAELVARATSDYQQAMWPALTGEGPAAPRLREALEALCATAERHMALLIALRAQSDAIFHRHDEEEALTRTVFTEPLEKLLRDGAADGTLRARSTPSRRPPCCSTSWAGPTSTCAPGTAGPRNERCSRRSTPSSTGC